MTEEKNQNLPIQTKTETSLDVLMRVEDTLQDLLEVLSQMRFYIIGTFVTITVIGALYAFFLIYALVIIPRQN